MKRIKSYLIDAQTLIEGLESPDESSKGEELDTLWSLIESKRIEVLILTEEWEALKSYLYDKISSRKRAEAILDNISKAIKVSSKDKDKGLKLISLSRISRDRDGDSASVEAIVIQHSAVARDPSTLVLESFISIAALWLTQAIAEIKSEDDDYIADRISALFDATQLPEFNFQAFIDRQLNTRTEADNSAADGTHGRSAKNKSREVDTVAARGVDAAEFVSNVLEDWDTLISAINSPGEQSGVVYERVNPETEVGRVSSPELPVTDSGVVGPAQSSGTQGVRDTVQQIEGTEDAVDSDENSFDDEAPPATGTSDSFSPPTIQYGPQFDPNGTDLPGDESLPVNPISAFISMSAAPQFSEDAPETPLADSGLAGDQPYDNPEMEPPLSTQAAYEVIEGIVEVMEDIAEVDDDSELLVVVASDETIDEVIDQSAFEGEGTEDTLISGDGSLLAVTDDAILAGGIDSAAELPQFISEVANTTDFNVTSLNTIDGGNVSIANSYDTSYGVIEVVDSALEIAPVLDEDFRISLAIIVLHGPLPV
ncbi:MAG: hypothetical protein AAFN08_09235 [Cyanobacteria bacterium J06559_3]